MECQKEGWSVPPGDLLGGIIEILFDALPVEIVLKGIPLGYPSPQGVCLRDDPTCNRCSACDQDGGKTLCYCDYDEDHDDKADYPERQRHRLRTLQCIGLRERLPPDQKAFCLGIY